MNPEEPKESKKGCGRKSKILEILKNVLIWSVVLVVIAFLFVVLYQLFKFILVSAILLVAFLFPSRRW